MLVSLEGPPLKSLLCEMGGATDAGQPRGTTSEAVVLTFYSPTPGATEFSDRATTDRGWVSVNTSG